MKHLFLFLGIILTFAMAHAQTDSIDVSHYHLTLDIDHLSPNNIQGNAELTLSVLRPVSSLDLELKYSNVDSVWVNGSRQNNFSYTSPLLSIPSGNISVGDTVVVTVFYHGGGYSDADGWGGFHMDNNIHYNLGVSFSNYPHNYGRSWFPCRDNFHDKATYQLTITTKPGWKALCGGQLSSVVTNSDSSTTFDWHLDLPTPTYLVSVAVAPFSIINRQYQGLYGTYPAIIGFQNYDSTRVYQAYDILEDVVPMYERCFGPYRWGRIGYVGTPKGSMEHVNNIALVNTCMASSEVGCQSVICHELSHAWFGNLVTCATSQDMWFNEGGASFCEEVALEAAFGKQYAKEYAEQNLETVLRTTHISDGSYRAVYGPTSDLTYGSTTYDKGATVWHTIRGYLGDSLFYSSMRMLFDRMAFSTITSAQLRDSLSSYSGIPLDDLFSFHVFSPGFQDFRIDSMQSLPSGAIIRLRQTLVGTDTYANSNKVPVTFFDDRLQSATRIVSFDGESTLQQVALPFSPVLAVVDLGSDLSKASICDTLMPTQKGFTELATAHFRTNVKKLDSTAATLLCVTHHWTAPDPSDNPGFVRLANRYWTVDGILPSGTSLTGMFRYSRTAGNATNAYLDHGFYNSSSSFDSIQLLYRPDCSQPWTIIRSQVSGNSSEGYLTINKLYKGEYTLAIVDSSLLSVNPPDLPEETSSMTIMPNPNNGQFSVQINRPGSYTLTVRDVKGRRMLTRRGVSSSISIAHSLPNGIYFVELKEKNHTIEVEKMVISKY